MLIGPATRDANIDYTGKEVSRGNRRRCFLLRRSSQGGWRNLFLLLVKIHPNDTDIIDAFADSDHVSLSCRAETTTLMQNTHFTADRARQSQGGMPRPVRHPHHAGSILGGRLYRIIWQVCWPDFERADRRAGKRQGLRRYPGFLRHNEGGLMNFHDWLLDKPEYLKYFDFSRPRRRPRSSPV